MRAAAAFIFLAATVFSPSIGEDYPIDLSYGDEPQMDYNPEWPQNLGPEERNSDAPTDAAGRGVLDVDPRGGPHPLDGFGLEETASMASEHPSWNFNAKEWAEFHAGDEENSHLPVEGTPRHILLATPKNPSKKIIFTVDALNSTKVRLHYKFFIKRGESDPEVPRPDLKIFLSMNGSSMLLTMEKEGPGWRSEELKFATGIQEQVVFVAQLNSRLNEIALGDVWLEDLAGPSFPEGAVKEPPSKDTSAKDSKDAGPKDSSAKKEAPVTSSYTHLGREKDPAVPLEVTPFETSTSEGRGTAEGSPTERGNRPLLTFPPGVNPQLLSNEEKGRPTEPSIVMTGADQDLSAVKGPVPALPPPTANTKEDDTGPATASTGSGLKIFFSCTTLLAVTVVIVYFVRRRRRSKRDDEVPVFNRGAAEHQNPSFATADVEVDLEGTGRSSNYRSFQ